jgi:hypothetical protein
MRKGPNPSFSEIIRDSKGRSWGVTVFGEGARWTAEGYPIKGHGLRARAGRPLIVKADSESDAYDRLSDRIDRRNPYKNLAAEGWKSVSGVKVDRADFAYVGDPTRNETWKLPLDTEGRTRNAMARFSRTHLPKSARRSVAEKIVAAGRRYGIDSGAFERKYLGRKNPPETEQAAELYRQFHDKDPKELIEVQEADEVRGTYVALGKLAELVFRAPGGGKVKLDFGADDTKLASSPAGTQLYLIGGDQALNGGLEKFGSDTTKDFVDLGEADSVTYRARKSATNFNLAAWKHRLGENGGTRPWGFYDKLRKRIYLVGGSYTVSDWIRN